MAIFTFYFLRPRGHPMDVVYGNFQILHSYACNPARAHIHTCTYQPANSYASVKVCWSESWPGLKHHCDLEG